MTEESIPGGYTEIKVLSDTMIEAWYQCANPSYPCPTGNTTWKEFSRRSDLNGSHGGCANCLMTGIVWIKILPDTPPRTNNNALIIVTGLAIAYLMLKGKLK